MFKMVVLLSISLAQAELPPAKTVLVPEGTYVSFFKEEKDKTFKVPSFYLDVHPVTNQQFHDFVLKHPNLKKSKIPRIFADSKYLQHWSKDSLSPSEMKKIGQQPVTFVSWFVARKYCESQGKRLPTIAEWEFAGDIENPEVLQTLLAWYAKTGDVEPDNIAGGKPNKFGVHDMHGLIWEWVEDFSSVMISSDSRSKGDRTDGFYCGGGSVNAKDAKAYATFMRYGFRSGLRGDYALRTLGFRCASDLTKGTRL